MAQIYCGSTGSTSLIIQDKAQSPYVFFTLTKATWTLLGFDTPTQVGNSQAVVFTLAISTATKKVPGWIDVEAPAKTWP